ncbi:MAG: YigZ family protein [Clostridia bacterium]|nr:YigZ family protein [Clostridia bacterium]
MELKPYKTLLSASKDELIINKSRFICRGFPAGSEEEALSFLKHVRGIHQDATHNCYAYAIGANMGIMRYSDDGEPGGTAGLPMMEVIKARGVTNLIVIITRYFGGVLLGAGGLVRAYSQGTALAIDACGVGTVYPTTIYAAEIAYSLLGRAEYFLASQSVSVDDKQFTDKVTITISVRSRDAGEFEKAFIAALDGRVEIVKLDEIYRAWQDI